MNKIFIAFFTLWCGISWSQNQKIFDQATSFYNENQYYKALDRYKEILKNGKESAELYYNMGNTYYKLDSVGKSIYYYEKALYLNPEDSDVLNNLAIANQKTVDIIDHTSQSFMHQFITKITFLYYDTWAVLSVIFMMLSGLCFLIYYFSYRVSFKKIFFTFSFIFFSLSLFSLGSSYYKYSLYQTPYAVVLSESTAVKEEPNMTGDKLFDIHEGTKVQILESLGNWSRIKISSGKIGWLISSDISVL